MFRQRLLDLGAAQGPPLTPCSSSVLSQHWGSSVPMGFSMSEAIVRCHGRIFRSGSSHYHLRPPGCGVLRPGPEPRLLIRWKLWQGCSASEHFTALSHTTLPLSSLGLLLGPR